MPIYAHQCECGHELVEYRRIVDWDQNPDCPLCNRPMPQVLAPPMVRGNYKKPIELQSMGFIAAPEDVAEHRRRFPGVELRFDNGSAIPVVKSLAQKRQYLKASGWVDTKSFT